MHAKYVVLLAKSEDPVPLLTEMIEQFPDVIDYHQARGEVYENGGQLNESKVIFARVTELLEKLLSRKPPATTERVGRKFDAAKKYDVNRRIL
ncbi:MAG: hypothetical protein R3C20_03430 [Planctomycetaceae bacterium]